MNTQKLTLIVILAFAIKFWVFKPYVVTSNSMNSTLKQGDYLIVNKWENSILGNHVKPIKDDVIAFHYPLDKGDIARQKNVWCIRIRANLLANSCAFLNDLSLSISIE